MDHGGGITAAFGTEEIQEEDVWAIMTTSEGSKSKSKTKKYNSSGSSSSSAWRRFTAAPRAIPRSTTSSGGSGGNSSAPVDIPDWNKILKKKTNRNLWDDACNDDTDDDYDMGRKNYEHSKFDEVENYDDDDGDDERVPPHEYIARRLANTQIASFSMCEGVGRTLKGRDLSKLRNAILTKTGFLEQ